MPVQHNLDSDVITQKDAHSSTIHFLSHQHLNESRRLSTGQGSNNSFKCEHTKVMSKNSSRTNDVVSLKPQSVEAPVERLQWCPSHSHSYCVSPAEPSEPNKEQIL